MKFDTEKFYRDYHNNHYCCPNCGSRNFSCTLMGFILDESHPEEYKDRNHVTCHNCGWKGIYHDLAPKPSIKEFKEAVKQIAGIYYSDEVANELLDIAAKIYND